MNSLFRTTLRKCRNRAADVYSAAVGGPRSTRKPVSVTEASDVTTALVESKAVLAQPLVMTVPLNRLRDGVGRSFSYEHPYVKTLREDATGDGSLVLAEYYRVCRCITALEVMDIAESEAPGLRGLPAASFVMPWHRIDPVAIARRRDRFMKEAGRRHGMDISLADGQNLFGPVSMQKLQLELRRLRTLCKSMETAGYRRGHGPDGDINGELLVDPQGEWCVRVRWGLHRTAVAAHLGYKTLPIRFELPPVDRASVALWPQVIAGRLTDTGALMVFNRFMRGQAPSSCGGW